MKQRLFLSFILVSLIISLLAAGCGPKTKTPLVVFAAGSLINPFNELEKAFEAANPQIDVLPEYHGSIQVIRHATELNEAIDVVATADYALIPPLMYQVNVPETGKSYASWYLRFATNRLGLAYTARSRYADEINDRNWVNILARQDVRVGIADPRFDASGYRALMVVKLAEILYNNPNLFGNLFSGQFRYPVKAAEDGEGWLVHVPEIMETRKDAHVVLRGASIMLLALLESGDLDYAFEYESVIQQHGLKLVALPPELNLGDPAQNPFYGQVSVKMDFKRFASVNPEFRGEQIGYGITIPSNAPHPKEAEKFIAFLFSPEGRKIMQDQYHPLYDPPLADGYDNLPAGLKSMASPMP
jgi:molybdate/tungstate transport system substrate-binding protein